MDDDSWNTPSSSVSKRCQSAFQTRSGYFLIHSLLLITKDGFILLFVGILQMFLWPLKMLMLMMIYWRSFLARFVITIATSLGCVATLMMYTPMNLEMGYFYFTLFLFFLRILSFEIF